MEKEIQHNSSKDDNTASRRQQTKSYKHVSLKRERPQLSKGAKKSAPSSTAQAEQEKRGTANRRGKRGGAASQGHAVRANANSELKIIPLGGLDAIGKNMTVFECEGDILLDDAGLMFPDDQHPGVDLILPDYTYLLENASKLRGIVITHGHEDHTGCLPYLLKDLDFEVPIYTTKLTRGLIEIKFKEHHITNVKWMEVKPGEQVRIGKFTVDFFSVNHSIPDAVGIFIQSPAGTVLHTGDFKLDQTPIDGVRTDYDALTRFSRIGVDLFMSDSTNAVKQGFTPSEALVGRTLDGIISQARGKVVIASFASHIHRMQQICDAAVKNGRKVVVTGRSMIQNTDVARRLGYLHISDEDIIDAYYLSSMPPEKVVVLCTGSQGEPLSALARIAGGNHKTIEIDPEDTVIISATPVPGNEKAVTKVINLLAKIGCDVYDKNRSLVHVSGHASAEELKLILSMVKPKYFLPVHGESQHLMAHARLAMDTGIDPDNIFMLENGDSLVMNAQGVDFGESVQSGIVYVEGLSVGDTSQEVLDERNMLREEGVAVVVAAAGRRKHEVLGEIQVHMRGIAGGDDPYLIEEAKRTINGSMKRSLTKELYGKSLEKALRDALSSLLWERIKQRPMIIVSVIELP